MKRTIIRNRQYVAVAESDTHILHKREDADTSVWKNFAVEVKVSPTKRLYHIAWNGERFALSEEYKRFLRDIPEAQPWVLSLLSGTHSNGDVTGIAPVHPRAPRILQKPIVPTGKTQFDLLLLDLDDTLVRSRDLEPFRGRAFLGPQSSAYVQALRAQLGANTGREIYPQGLLHQIRVQYPALRIGVFTRAPRHYTEILLSHFYPGFHWDVVIPYEDVSRTKPAGDGIWHAMKILGITDISRVALLGDSSIDVSSSYNSGCWSILDRSGWRHPMETDYWRALEKVPDIILTKPLDLLPALNHPVDLLPALERWTLTNAPPCNNESLRVDRIRHFLPRPETESCIVNALGRSFSNYATLRSRQSWHAVSQQVMTLKNAQVFPDAWVGTLHYFLRTLPPVQRGAATTVTVVPAKPGRYPRLERFLVQLEHFCRATNPPLATHVRFATDIMAYRCGVLSQHAGHLDRNRRFDNVRDHLYVPQPTSIRGRHAVVIDDVVTTGASLLYSHLYLLQAGACSVTCVAMTKAVGEQ